MSYFLIHLIRFRSSVEEHINSYFKRLMRFTFTFAEDEPLTVELTTRMIAQSTYLQAAEAVNECIGFIPAAKRSTLELYMSYLDYRSVLSVLREELHEVSLETTGIDKCKQCNTFRSTIKRKKLHSRRNCRSHTLLQQSSNESMRNTRITPISCTNNTNRTHLHQHQDQKCVLHRATPTHSEYIQQEQQEQQQQEQQLEEVEEERYSRDLFDTNYQWSSSLRSETLSPVLLQETIEYSQLHRETTPQTISNKPHMEFLSTSALPTTNNNNLEMPSTSTSRSKASLLSEQLLLSSFQVSHSDTHNTQEWYSDLESWDDDDSDDSDDDNSNSNDTPHSSLLPVSRLSELAVNTTADTTTNVTYDDDDDDISDNVPASSTSVHTSHFNTSSPKEIAELDAALMSPYNLQDTVDDYGDVFFINRILLTEKCKKVSCTLPSESATSKISEQQLEDSEDDASLESWEKEELELNAKETKVASLPIKAAANYINKQEFESREEWGKTVSFEYGNLLEQAANATSKRLILSLEQQRILLELLTLADFMGDNHLAQLCAHYLSCWLMQSSEEELIKSFVEIDNARYIPLDVHLTTFEQPDITKRSNTFVISSDNNAFQLKNGNATNFVNWDKIKDKNIITCKGKGDNIQVPPKNISAEPASKETLSSMHYAELKISSENVTSPSFTYTNSTSFFLNKLEDSEQINLHESKHICQQKQWTLPWPTRVALLRKAQRLKDEKHKDL